LLEKLESAHGKIDRIYASGGFTESKWWVQLLATILQRPLLVPEETADASSMGAIAVAMKAEGKMENWSGFGEISPVALLQYNPDVQTKLTYDNNFQHYLRLCHS
jgi:gluconokinase